MLIEATIATKKADYGHWIVANKKADRELIQGIF